MLVYKCIYVFCHFVFTFMAHTPPSQTAFCICICAMYLRLCPYLYLHLYLHL